MQQYWDAAKKESKNKVQKKYNNVEAFHEKLLKSKRILAVCGAGLSAPSGIPTYRGPGGLWTDRNAANLATPQAFADDPGLVWLFYTLRRREMMRAKPNPGHHALAALAKKKADFLCLSQNIDNLHPRANHPPDQLRLLHGSISDIKCSKHPICTWIKHDNFDDSFCPALAAATEDINPGKDPKETLPHIPASELPKCPKCKTGIQRPGIVWFNEGLNKNMLNDIEGWMDEGVIDMVLVIGTTSVVYPAAGYSELARTEGHTSVVTVNLDAESESNLEDLYDEDFAFAGSAADLLPKLFEPVIGRPVGGEGRYF